MRSAYDCDVLVIGGGIVGLSTAYAVTRAAPGTRVTVLEKEQGPARHQTGRNSGVIHSGIYYRPGSLKARYAVQGAAEMVKFCAEYDIPHAVTGKLIVATEKSELPACTVWCSAAGRTASRSRNWARPSSPTTNPRSVASPPSTSAPRASATTWPWPMRLAEASGAEIRYGAQVVRADRRPHLGVAVRTADGTIVRGRVLVNCAGLHCDETARLTGDDPGMRIVPFRGEYYTLARPELVRGLVYPVPDPAFPFLGVHLTRGIDGGVHIGPNAVPALAREGYGWKVVRPRELGGTLSWPGSWRIARRHWRYGAGELRRSVSKSAFTEAVRRLLPAVTPEDLVPAAAGVRAQAVLRDGTLVDDFLIKEGPRTVHVLNAPSPAATASLPIGREVARRALAALAAV